MEEAVERRLANPLGGRAHGAVRRHGKPPPPPAPADYADHGPVPVMGSGLHLKLPGRAR